MTKIENRDFALIFSGKRLFNTLSKIDLSDIVIITMNFHQHLAWQMFDSKILRHKQCVRSSIQQSTDPVLPSLLHKSASKRNWSSFDLISILYLNCWTWLKGRIEFSTLRHIEVESERFSSILSFSTEVSSTIRWSVVHLVAAKTSLVENTLCTSRTSLAVKIKMKSVCVVKSKLICYLNKYGLQMSPSPMLLHASLDLQFPTTLNSLKPEHPVFLGTQSTPTSWQEDPSLNICK